MHKHNGVVFDQFLSDERRKHAFVYILTKIISAFVSKIKLCGTLWALC